ncbi:cyanophycinase [Thalassomonas sp. M1454]|uniref:cyanophycinase n=1 Tax=Thalassomonas sp. M1454 TaxID=2594477 RepID=UPI00118169CB|nr:cyanophycinase [Thalassomonas sp. M1454]TRX55169.1 hypothetical protein FNN08_11310 [Thalassomonas sp. M1454]
MLRPLLFTFLVPSFLLFIFLLTPIKLSASELLGSKLFLVGGGLKTCSSQNQKQCKENVNFVTAKQESVYRVAENQTKLFNDYAHHFSEIEQITINNILLKINKLYGSKDITKSQLRESIKKFDTQKVINSLNDFKYYLLHDLIEIGQFENNLRTKERSNLKASKDLFSQEIYNTFVDYSQQIANGKKPKVVVLTASARDPFEAADFYQSVFEQAGANSQWLPLDATLNQAWQSPNITVCDNLEKLRLEQNGSTNRAVVYPDLVEQQKQACLNPALILEAIKNADGVFINGGDQSLTRKAFINNDGTENQILTAIKQKLNQGKLIVGGTSAGTAVMSGNSYLNSPTVMVSNGTSEAALNRGAKADMLPVEGCQKTNQCAQNLLNTDLTYNSQGGLGLVNFAIMDTHFSERGRQGRVAVLAKHTNASFVLGVDEATAAVIDWPTQDKPIQFKVIGAKGVFVLQPKAERVANIHYLTRGDSAEIEGKHIAVKFNKQNADIKLKTSTKTDNIFTGENFKKLAKGFCYLTQDKIKASYQWQEKIQTISLKRNVKTRTHSGETIFKGKNYSYCSYTNLEFYF